MPIWIAMAMATLLGVLVTFQPLMNAILSRAVGSPFGAAAISILVAALGAIGMVALTGRGDMSRAALASVPWWVYLAGFIGTLFVAGGAVLAPLTGALLFFTCVIGGQLLGALLADHFGLFGIEPRPATVARLVGLALVLGGALISQRG
jgi:transporter family-2 protein